MNGMINEMVRKMSTRPQIYTPDWQYNPTSIADRRILDYMDEGVYIDYANTKEDEELVEVHEDPEEEKCNCSSMVTHKAGIGNLIMFAIAGILIGAIIYNIVK